MMDGAPAEAAAVLGPMYLSGGPDGTIVYSDSRHRVRALHPNGTVSTVAGSGLSSGGVGDGGSARAAGIATPAGVAINATGHVVSAPRLHLLDNLFQFIHCRDLCFVWRSSSPTST